MKAVIANLNKQNFTFIVCIFLVQFLIVPSIFAQNELNIHQTKTAPVIDGNLNDECWSSCDSVYGFIELLPQEGKEPEVRTVFYFTYDANNFYIGFKCYDKDITLLRSSFGKKDTPIYNDDHIEISIWPSNNAQERYDFYLNANNIKMDSYQLQSTIDFDWESATKISKEFWSGEIQIPLETFKVTTIKDLRWKYLLQRYYPRNDAFTYAFPQISLNISSRYGQANNLIFNDQIETGTKKYSFTPYVISSVTGSRSNSAFKNEKPELRYGVDRFQYLFSKDASLTLAVRPDFSTAELDAPIIDVNQKYAISYPEKRSFFFDGYDIFQFTSYNSSIFETRSLNDPSVIGKFTGKVEQISYGFISEVERNTSFLIPLEETSLRSNTDLKSFNNIFRARYDSGENYLGAIMTSRNISGGHNYVFGLDGYYLLNEQNMLTFSLVKSYTKEINNTELNIEDINFGNHTSLFDGEYFSGSYSYLKYRLATKNIAFYVSYEDISPEFRADNGFVNHNNSRLFTIDLAPKIYFENDFLRRVDLELYWNAEWNYHNIKKNQELYGSIGCLLVYQTFISFGFSQNFERFDEINSNPWNFHIVLMNSSFKFLNIISSYYYGTQINYSKPDDPLGYYNNFSLGVGITPSFPVNFQVNYQYYDLLSNDRTLNIYKGETLNANIIWQIYTTLNFRTQIQRDTFQKKITTSFLVSYEPSAFTGVYFGFYNKFEEIPKILNIYGNIYLKIKYTF